MELDGDGDDDELLDVTGCEAGRVVVTVFPLLYREPERDDRGGRL